MSDTIDVPEGRDLDTDLELLVDEFVRTLEHNTDTCYGSWGNDCKRPFGNSGRYQIARDILDIIGVDLEEDVPEDDREGYEQYAHDLYGEIGPYLRDKWLERKPKPNAEHSRVPADPGQQA